MSNIKSILDERKVQHGDIRDHSEISQALKDSARCGVSWDNMTDVQKEVVEMILHKVARIVSGDPNHKDHYDDIAGYSTLASNAIDSV